MMWKGNNYWYAPGSSHCSKIFQRQDIDPWSASQTNLIHRPSPRFYLAVTFSAAARSSLQRWPGNEAINKFRKSAGVEG